jgi:outer membrane protein TolC
MIRRAVLYVVLAISPAAWCQQASSPSGDVLTVAQVVALALQNNVNVKNAILGVGQSEDKLTAVRTKRLPSLKLALIASHLLTPIDLIFNEGAFGTFPATGPIPAGRTTLRTSTGFKTDILAHASQPLSQLYRIGLDIQEFEAKRDVALQQLRLQQQTVVFDVKQAYYTLLQTQSALEATEENIASLRELDRITENYVKQQTALKSQSLSVKSQLANAEYQAVTQRNTLASQQEQVNELLGRDIRTPFRVNPAPEATPFENDLAAAQARALQQRPEIKNAQLQVTEANYKVRIKQSEYIPDLSLVVRYLSPITSDELPKNIAYAGLEFSWDIYDWGRKNAEMAERRKAMEQASNTVQDTERQVLMDINNQFRTLKATREQLRAARVAQEAARETLREAMNQYQQKTALLQNVLQDQAALAQANQQYQQALSSFWTAKANFERALGEE